MFKIIGENHKVMQAHNLVSIVTVAALLLFAATGVRVGMARVKHGVKAPAMTGHEIFERHSRVQGNTLEQLVIFLPAMWLFASYWNDPIAAGLGVVWLVGRVIYMRAYVSDPAKRSFGFLIGMIVNTVFMIGAVIGAVESIVATGAL